MWILKAKFNGTDRPRLLTDKEMALLESSMDFLLWVRKPPGKDCGLFRV
jgi:hypothetical protein